MLNELLAIKACLERENQRGAISDTLWISRTETLFDFVDAAIEKAQAEARLPNSTPMPCVHIDFKQASELLEMFGGQPSEITLTNGEGHSGPGLYAFYRDLPEEGSFFLGVTDDDATPQGAEDAPDIPLLPIEVQAATSVPGHA